MKDLIRKRLTEYRTEAMDSIGVAVNRTKSKAAGTGNLNSSKVYLAINEDNKAGFEAYMDRFIAFDPHLWGMLWRDLPWTNTPQLIEDARATYHDVVAGRDSRIQRSARLRSNFLSSALVGTLPPIFLAMVDLIRLRSSRESRH
jgi:hypothetical protein